MKRLLFLLLLPATVFADVTTVVSPTVDVDMACVAATAAAASAGAASVTRACPATRNVTATYTPPIILPPKPADETRTTACTAPLIGNWVQTRTYAVVSNAWVAGPWLPAAPPTGACTTPPPPPSSAVLIKTKAGFCLDASTPTAVVQRVCDVTKPGQAFDSTTIVGHFAQSGACVAAPADVDGTQLAMVPCNDIRAVWTNLGGTLANVSSGGKCLDIPGSVAGVAGTKAQIWTCDNSGEQQFTTPTLSGMSNPPPDPPPTPASGAQTVTFTQSTEDFKNPGRGFYVSPKPSEMNVTTLTNFVNYWGTRLMLYSPDLSPYRNTALPQSFLSTVNTHIAAARAAGVKLIIWPQYNSDGGGADAPIGLALQHIQQLGTVWAKNADIIPFFKAGYIGSYGEWWGSQNGLDSDANKLAIKNAILANTPATSMVYIRTPADIQKWYPDPAAAAAARIAFHNDCYMANDTDAHTFPNGLNDSLRAYARGLTTFGFETCDNVSNPEQMRKTCAQALSENAANHATWGNKSYAPKFIDSWTVGGCLDKIGRSFGFRPFIPSVNYNATTTAGQPTTVAVNVQNVGNSGLFDDRALIVTLRNQATGALVSGSAGKLRAIAGGASATLSAVLTVPAGTYDILLSAPDPFPTLAADVRYAMRFANADSGAQKWVAPYFQTGASIKAQ